MGDRIIRIFVEIVDFVGDEESVAARGRGGVIAAVVPNPPDGQKLTVK